MTWGGGAQGGDEMDGRQAGMYYKRESGRVGVGGKAYTGTYTWGWDGWKQNTATGWSPCSPAPSPRRIRFPLVDPMGKPSPRSEGNKQVMRPIHPSTRARGRQADPKLSRRPIPERRTPLSALLSGVFLAGAKQPRRHSMLAACVDIGPKVTPRLVPPLSTHALLSLRP